MSILKKALGIGMHTVSYIISSEKIPKEFDGFKIVHLSDFHGEPKKGMVERIKTENPDVIFMTGDMVDDKEPYKVFLKLLEVLLKIAPVYMISGNHDSLRADYNRFKDECKKLGAIYIEDSGVLIKRKTDEIMLYGIEDSAFRVPELLNKKIEDSLKKLNDYDGYKILLFHRANKLVLVLDKGFDLILSGHMHGGQIRVAGLGGILSPKSGFADSGKIVFPKFSGGRYSFDSGEVIVNCGMGNPIMLPRFGNPTEIVLITLKTNNM